MNSLTVLAGTGAAVSTVMLTTGLALATWPSHLRRTLRPYSIGLADDRRSVADVVRQIVPNLISAWEALATFVPLQAVESRLDSLAPWLGRQIVRADLSITVRELLLASLGVIVAALGLGFLLWGTTIMAGASAVFSLAVLVLYIRHRQGRRLRAFGDQLPDVLSILNISLRAGYSIMQALDSTSRQIRQPASMEFATVLREVRIGVSAEQALQHLAERVKNEDLGLLIGAIRLHRETGGNLVNMVETIEDTARERVKIRGEVRSLTAQAALGGWVISLLPVVLAGFLYLLNPSGISFFWTDWLGISMGGGAVFSVILGNYILRRIAKIEL